MREITYPKAIGAGLAVGLLIGSLILVSSRSAATGDERPPAVANVEPIETTTTARRSTHVEPRSSDTESTEPETVPPTSVEPTVASSSPPTTAAVRSTSTTAPATTAPKPTEPKTTEPAPGLSPAASSG